MKVVIDTNVVVSHAVSTKGAPARILESWVDGAFELIISEDLLAEYRRALHYPHVLKRHRYTSDQIDAFLEDIQASAITVTISHTLNAVAEDPDDNKVIECAIAGEADYIVSGDAHLLSLAEYKGIPILSPAAFLMVLGRE